MDKKTKTIGETKEVLDAIGQPSEKEGIKWTKYFMDKFERKEWKNDCLSKERLGRRRVKRKYYHQLLAKMLYEKLVEFEKPAFGYTVIAYPTVQGVVAQFKDRWGRTWQKAFRPCGIPKVDYNAVVTYAGLAEDKMYELEEVKTTPSGIILP